MKKLYEFISNRLSTKTKNQLGSNRFLKPIRDAVLRRKGRFKETFVEIEKNYLEYSTNFRYYASIKSALKAKHKGVENTILTNSILLLKQLNNTNDDCVIVDVGSNFGYMSMVWGQSVCRNGKVHAFEANNDVYSSFLNSINFNGFANINLNYKALGNSNQTVKMYHMDTTSNFNNITNTDKFEMVDMLTLDSYDSQNDLGRCDVIKIDVDGIEYDILQGSIKVMQIYQPMYIVETNNDSRIVEFFTMNNYAVLDMKLKPYKSPSPLPSNIFCMPNDA